jgi:hypothetical protein
MTVVSKSHSSALWQRRALQLAFAALGALPLPLHAHAQGAYPELPPPPDAPPPEAPRDLPEPPPEANLQVTVAPPPAAPPAAGQWVYTQQYGWVWMPYGQSYTYVPAEGNPFMFVYGPTLGWRWVTAPWVFDYGPTPYWGVRGRAHFAWYSRPWFARRAYRPVYHREYHPVYRAPRQAYRRDYRSYRSEYRSDRDWHGKQAREVRGHGHSGHRR